MVEILCPHCEEEIELDDDASGEFACPHCGGEFEWNIQPEVEQFDEPDSLLLTLVSGFFSAMDNGAPALPILVRPVWSALLVSVLLVRCGFLRGVESDNLGGIGVVVMMGIAGAILVGLSRLLQVGFWGLSILLLGIARVLRT